MTSAIVYRKPLKRAHKRLSDKTRYRANPRRCVHILTQILIPVAVREGSLSASRALV